MTPIPGTPLPGLAPEPDREAPAPRAPESPVLSPRVPAPQTETDPRRLARLDDTVLMRLVGQGSIAAFGVLVDRHGPALYRVGARMLGDGHEAEDVVQDCFARLWQHAPHWQPSGAGLVGWLHRVTMNLCFDRKRRFRVITTPDLPEMVDAAPLADALIESDQAQGAVAEAIDALPERYRAALVLCYFEGMSNAMAAQVLNLNIKAMESLLFRARRQLREILVTRQVAWRELVASAAVERSHHA